VQKYVKKCKDVSIIINEKELLVFKTGESGELLMTLESTEVRSDLAGKYISFRLEDELYGIRLTNIREIIGMTKITAIPRAPEFVIGVINIRGKVLPVIDLRVRFGLNVPEITDRTPIIVCDAETEDGGLLRVGIIVDSVSEVLQVNEEDVEEPPSFGLNIDTKFIEGMSKVDGEVQTLLNISYVVTSSELGAIKAISDSISG
jgi:purine-binding chemotaxis protein CheW